MAKKNKGKKIGITTKILVCLVIGIIVGLIINLTGFSGTAIAKKWLIGGAFTLLGEVFMRAIKMLVVPLVFFSIASGTGSIADIKKIGRMGTKTLSFYLSTTAIACTLAMTLAFIINPGKGVNVSAMSSSQVSLGEPTPIVKVLYQIIPSNPIEAMAQGNMLQVIFFAILVGIVLAIIKKNMAGKIKAVNDLIEAGNELMLEMVMIIMKIFAPLGVFGLVAKSFSELGFDIMVPLLKYMIGVTLALTIHVTITYPSLLVLFGKLNPLTFFRKWYPAMIVGFSTSSSNASLPFSLEVAEERLGVKKEIAGFTLPLGATINMDGTSIMQGVATVFIAQLVGVDLNLTQILTVVLTATLASIGTAGIPGVGLIMLSMVLQAVGLPLDHIGLIMGIDRILDMLRTTVNITGDAVCTCIVAKTENEIDLDVFNSTKTTTEREESI